MTSREIFSKWKQKQKQWHKCREYSFSNVYRKKEHNTETAHTLYKGNFFHNISSTVKLAEGACNKIRHGVFNSICIWKKQVN